jgi:[acyl-carrier-protein] S-malonyltransferase
MIVLSCPGQGSQVPGFLSPWLENQTFRNSIEASSDVLKLDLVKYGTASDADEIRDTKVAQPLIVAAGIASYEVLKEKAPKEDFFMGVTGHSVGEITAAYIAGIFDNQSALKFVQTRGEQMAIAASLEQSSMAAVVGGKPDEVIAQLETLGLSAVNYNGPGQIVAAGAKELIQELIASPPAGTRVVGLAVAGAFHTKYMESAKKVLLELASNLSVSDPNKTIWTNNSGETVSSGEQFLELLVNQVSKPVRWDKTMDSMTTKRVSAIIELLPAGTLTGIAKRAMPGVELVALKSPEDIEKALEVIGRLS